MNEKRKLKERRFLTATQEVHYRSQFKQADRVANRGKKRS